jgi:thioredoxin
MATIELNKEIFEEKITKLDEKEWKFLGDKPAMIDFFSEWCNPCKMVGPIIEELSGEFEGIDMYKLDTEAQQELAGAFGVQSIPSILFIPMEGQPQMSVGALPKESFIKAFKEVLLVE